MAQSHAPQTAVVPIPGTKRRAYLEENVAANDVELDDKDLRPARRGRAGGCRRGRALPRHVVHRPLSPLAAQGISAKDGGVTADDSMLDNPVWAALTGPHAALADSRGRARRYPTDVSPFAALPSDAVAEDWHDLGRLVGPGGQIVRIGSGLPALPQGWQVQFAGEGVQLVATEALETGPYEEAVVLGEADVDEMLVAGRAHRAWPVPCPDLRVGRLPRGEARRPAGRDGRSTAATPGVHRDQRGLHRSRLRGQGFGTRLVQAVAHTIRARGETPMMHASASNTNAIRLYEALGFRVRTEVRFGAATAPTP